MKSFAAKCLSSARTATLVFGLLALTHVSARALILYSGSNTANTDASGTTAPFSSVVGVMNAAGTAYDASGIYLGNGYVLTAYHVNLYSTIELAGTQYSIDYSYSPTQIGTADLKLFRISGYSAASSVVLDTNSFNDTNKSATIVGYGVGIGSTTTSGYIWGDSSTADQRWGTNTVSTSTTNVYISSTNTTTSCLITTFDTTGGSNEAALSLGDSGGALFEYVSGQWVLSGVSLYVENAGESLYGDGNYYARVSTYSSTISTLINAVPEPESYALFLLGGSLIAFALRRRRPADA